MTDATNDILSDLDALLKTERDALLSGNLDAIARITEEKTALIEALGAAEPEPEELDEIRAKVRRNQDMLASSLKGIRAVAERMSELRRVRKEMTTYDANGQKTVVKTTLSEKMERRA
ncbi:hypothetical protein [Poseidonocella sedimentorum]|uniref:FlgN protein n=1 Tax=Poseidonocella sedimentorum TaxID=871652 RepID=A0A1I6D5C1_9RHOB|nr:hypothetical protein [Poseidonocella sedimentorum]SFR00620.1 hypothetical protein SAMN04515673_102190 [Poseidonocella sedimentorum]